jgi:hypothetical protein
MLKLLYILGIVSLITAGIFCFYSCNKWMTPSGNQESFQECSIIEQIKGTSIYIKQTSNQKVHPLIQEAQLFAVYLNPPEPPQPKEIFVSEPKPKPVVIAQKPVDITPQFNLIATSYNELRPQESLALVSEPGKGSHWIKSGESFGHFVLESIEHKAIVFSNGNQLQRFTIGSQAVVINEKITKVDKSVLASLDSEKTISLITGKIDKPASKPLLIHKSSTNIRKPFQKLGPQRSQTRLIARENNSNDKR